MNRFADSPDASVEVAELWRSHRQRVLDVCYRMLGTLADAEDATQETFLRLTRSGVDGIDDPVGWLVAVAGRVCIDRLRRDTSRERYIGPWLPSPVLEQVSEPAEGADPADRITLDDTIRIAMLTVLEQLSPAERAAFVLHDVFGLPFDRVAETVGRSPAACRQLASRARTRIRERGAPRFDVDSEAARVVAERFADACRRGDVEHLLAVLDPDVAGEFDSGGQIPGAPTTELVGADTIATVLLTSLAGTGADFDVEGVNAQPGVVVRLDGRVVAVITLETDDTVVHAIRAIGNPDKLWHLQG